MMVIINVLFEIVRLYYFETSFKLCTILTITNMITVLEFKVMSGKFDAGISRNVYWWNCLQKKRYIKCSVISLLFLADSLCGLNYLKLYLGS
jgi:hypothetical protein